jgi:hypothetical protein
MDKNDDFWDTIGPNWKWIKSIRISSQLMRMILPLSINEEECHDYCSRF